ncbi:MAG TPA: class I SAM-dependent methyltransferase [Candidatus Paceibacterota bacterium]
MNAKDSNPTSWGNVADWYDELLEESADSFQAKVILPNLSRLMDLRSGTSVLDVACGQGFFSRTFAQTGAKVTACDISPELIEIARSKSTASMEYKVAPADALTFAANESFNIVTIVLALQNIENLQGTFAEVARVLTRGGRAYFVLNHPSFRIPKRSSWQWDEKSNSQYRRVDAYLSDDRIDIDMDPGERNPRKKNMTVSFHRPLQVYFKAINKAGLCVARLEEWISHKKSQKGPRQAEEDRIRKEIPMFLMLEAVKK